jgi:regulator of PEP synthase PpsR (kinase-PPPase family)
MVLAGQGSALAGRGAQEATMAAKHIFIISDATGQSDLHIVRAALVQFDQSKAKMSVYHDIDTKTGLKTVLDEARKAKALVAFTIVKKEMRDFANAYCLKHGVIHHDILGPLIFNLSDFLHLEPLETPSLLRKVDDRYFMRIDAIEFTLGHDDGRGVERLRDADLVIVGLSRSSKTPTSFYLAQQGYKVANVPVVPGIPLPGELDKIDQEKVVCLVIEPEVLQKVRQARQKRTGVKSSYVDIRNIFSEVQHVDELIRKHRGWKVVDTTNKSIEETAWEIIHKVFGERHGEYR